MWDENWRSLQRTVMIPQLTSTGTIRYDTSHTYVSTTSARRAQNPLCTTTQHIHYRYYMKL